MTLKLGNNFSKPDSRDLQYENYRSAKTAVLVPEVFGHGNTFKDWGMLGNDQYGDCVFAGADHEQMLIANLALPGAPVGVEPVKFTPENALADYGAVTGFDPQTGEGDNGTDPRESFKYRQKTGLIDASGKRHKIAAYVSIPVTNIAAVIEATFIFDAVGIGFEFPGSAMEQFNNGEPWAVVKGAQIEGGHYVPIVGKPSKGNLAIVTWAKRQVMTEAFYKKYTVEAWAFITQESLNAKTQRNWGGYNWEELQKDLQKV
jgi:hypothetical protein